MFWAEPSFSARPTRGMFAAQPTKTTTTRANWRQAGAERILWIQESLANPFVIRPSERVAEREIFLFPTMPTFVPCRFTTITAATSRARRQTCCRRCFTPERNRPMTPTAAKRPPGRPRKEKHERCYQSVDVQMDPPLLCALDSHAEAECASRSEVIRRACSEYLRRAAKRSARQEEG